MYALFSLARWSVTLATVLAIVAMLFEETTHASAGATAMIAY